MEKEWTLYWQKYGSNNNSKTVWNFIALDKAVEQVQKCAWKSREGAKMRIFKALEGAKICILKACVEILIH